MQPLIARLFLLTSEPRCAFVSSPPDERGKRGAPAPSGGEAPGHGRTVRCALPQRVAGRWAAQYTWRNVRLAMRGLFPASDTQQALADQQRPDSICDNGGWTVVFGHGEISHGVYPMLRCRSGLPDRAGQHRIILFAENSAMCTRLRRATEWDRHPLPKRRLSTCACRRHRPAHHRYSEVPAG